MPARSYPADERILEFLGEHPPEYVPIVANRLGIHVRHAEHRAEVLVEKGLPKPVSNEMVYTTTAAGDRALAEDGAVAPAPAEPTTDD